MDFLSNLDLWAGIGRGFFCICGFYAGVQLGKWLKEQHLDKDGKVASGWKALEVVVALLGLALPICFMQVLDEAKKSQILDTQQEYCQMENSEEQCKAFQEALGGDSLGEKL